MPREPELTRRMQAPSSRSDSLYALECDGENIFFLNNSEERLDSVRATHGTWETIGDDVLSTAGDALVVADVRPNEEIVIGYYDVIRDSDYSFEFQIEVRSATRGVLRFSPMFGKGCCPNGTLLWRDLPPLLAGENGSPLSAQEAARGHRQRSGLSLSNAVFLNDGDLSMPYAGKRLAGVGLDLVSSSHRRGTVHVYDFIDGTGALVFRAHDRAAASAFVRALRE